MSIITGIIVVLIGKIFTKFEKNQFAFVFWITIIITTLVIVAETIVINVKNGVRPHFE